MKGQLISRLSGPTCESATWARLTLKKLLGRDSASDIEFSSSACRSPPRPPGRIHVNIDSIDTKVGIGGIGSMLATLQGFSFATLLLFVNLHH